MTEEAKVSLWIGNASSRDAFERALQTEFSEDGDFMGSPFSRAFEIGYYDEGLKEADYHEGQIGTLSELLQQVSYADKVIPGFAAIAGRLSDVNCYVLLYDFCHTGISVWHGEGVVLRYVGCVDYR